MCLLLLLVVCVCVCLCVVGCLCCFLSACLLFFCLMRLFWRVSVCSVCRLYQVFVVAVVCLCLLGINIRLLKVRVFLSFHVYDSRHILFACLHRARLGLTCVHVLCLCSLCVCFLLFFWLVVSCA